MNIYEFVRGDEIVRIQPSKPYSSGTRDRSYMGEKVIFFGIDNGKLHFKRPDNFSQMIFGDILFDLPLDLWDEGWELYVDPTKLLVKDFKFGR